jgi:hypothetical protein
LCIRHVLQQYFKITIPYFSSVEKNSFVGTYQMRGNSKSNLFAILLLQNLRDHLTHTSLSIGSCYMNHLQTILRIAEMFEKFLDLRKSRLEKVGIY